MSNTICPGHLVAGTYKHISIPVILSKDVTADLHTYFKTFFYQEVNKLPIHVRYVDIVL